MASKDTVRLGLLLFPQFSLMSFSSALEPLRSANRLLGREYYHSTSHFSSSYRRAYRRRPTDVRQPRTSLSRNKGAAPGKRAASRMDKIH